jgi:small subunit ribosomal protein S8
MSMTDPIADLLSRIRNGHLAGHEAVDVPASKIKEQIVTILAAEGYVDGLERLPGTPFDTLRVRLRYARDGRQAITGLQRVSRPGRRVYCGKGAVPAVLDGLGVTIVSTSRGVMTGDACRRQGLGGEVLVSVW